MRGIIGSSSQRAIITMRGVHKGGPGLTGVQRVLNTRERVSEFDDPCKVRVLRLIERLIWPRWLVGAI